MASNHTANFGLNQWAATDPVLREDFNADNRKIEEAMAEMAATLVTRGNCSIATGSYVGTGEKGISNPVTLTFEFPPKFLLVRDTGYSTSLYGFSGWFLWCAGGTSANAGMAGNNANYPNVVTNQGNTISWYNTYDVGYQLNIAQHTYYYIALG